MNRAVFVVACVCLCVLAVAGAAACPCEFVATSQYNASTCEDPCKTIEAVHIESGAVGRSCCRTSGKKKVVDDAEDDSDGLEEPEAGRAVAIERLPGNKDGDSSLDKNVSSRYCRWYYYRYRRCYYYGSYYRCYYYYRYYYRCY